MFKSVYRLPSTVYLFVALLFLLVTCYLLLVTFTPTAHADFTILQPRQNGGVPVATDQTGESLVQTIVGNVIIIFFTIAGLGAVVMLLWGAIEWIISGGEKEKIAKARGRIVNAIIGLVLIALAFVIIRIVGQIIGFNPLGNLTLPFLGTPSQTITNHPATGPCTQQMISFCAAAHQTCVNGVCQ